MRTRQEFKVHCEHRKSQEDVSLKYQFAQRSGRETYSYIYGSGLSKTGIKSVEKSPDADLLCSVGSVAVNPVS